MKLLQKTSYYFLSISLIIISIGGVCIFFALQYMLDHELDESLFITRTVLYEELEARDTLPAIIKIMDEVIDIKEVSFLNDTEVYKDTLREIFEDGKFEKEAFRMYVYREKINENFYQIALNHSKFDRDNLLIVITSLIVGTLIFTLLILNLFNRYISRNIWKPFNHSLHQIKQFNLKKAEPFLPQQSDIEEFNLLNTALSQMTDKLLTDYNVLKQFTENASHETQTPLAIIRSQIELLTQGNISINQHKQLHEIELATNKLSKLNNALLLLSRIENRQFEETTSVDLDDLIRRKLESFDLMIQSKSIKVVADLSDKFVVANDLLMDILISNLISNAIKHNLQNGKVNILLDKSSMKIENEGQILTKPSETLFQRFSKDDDAGHSIGLGLAIAKEICMLYQWTIKYTFERGLHIIEINF